jgi:hypothetical protein
MFVDDSNPPAHSELLFPLLILLGHQLTDAVSTTYAAVGSVVVVAETALQRLQRHWE